MTDGESNTTTRPAHPSPQPLHRFQQHTAAVKALAWCPHKSGLLASGGGTADKCIRFWNASTGLQLGAVDTGSQVCQLAWSPSSPELLSAHGYSTNTLVVWRFPSMSRVATLTGHTTRVLYMTLAPDGESVCTGAGDETIRFWRIFGRWVAFGVPCSTLAPTRFVSFLRTQNPLFLPLSPSPLTRTPLPLLFSSAPPPLVQAPMDNSFNSRH